MLVKRIRPVAVPRIPHFGMRASTISKDEYHRWFRPVWDDVPGARTDRGHPAPFPIEIPYRIARMFSFTGDTILDVCAGSATTALGAAKAGRHSVCVDISANYLRKSIERLQRADLELLAA